MSSIKVDLPREEWEQKNYPIKSDRPFSSKNITYVTFHWPGAKNAWWKDHIDWLQRSQIDYTNNRGYSLGYGYSIFNKTGETAEIRGLEFRAASNGDSENGDDEIPGNPGLPDNTEVVSIIVVMAMNEELTSEAKLSMLNMVEKLRRKFADRTLIVNGHRDMDDTGCPGPEIDEFIDSGVFTNQGENPVKNLRGSGVMLGDIELLGGRSFRLGANYHMGGMNKLEIPVGIETDAVLANVTVIGESIGGWISFMNKETSVINWDSGTRIMAQVVPIVTKDGFITIYSEPQFSCRIIIDIIGRV